jgi:hypothetical protein
MAAVADSGAIYGLYNRRDRHHGALRGAIAREPGAILIPAAILSEVDYLLGAKLGVSAELDFMDDILGGAFALESFTVADLHRSRELIEQYATLNIGLADAAVIATAERLGTRRILTVDERHFRVVRAVDGKPFTLLPADS